ncbi:MAG: T9SS type A sorting domain-containing protein [Flavobacteriales bacterium]|nr:T9SS type A sorting domain-containing protein [Flavobacteriales bacterium]
MRSLTFSLALAVGSGCTAQTVLTDANSSPQPGDAYVRGQGSYLDPAPIMGGTTTYDYSGLGPGWVDTLRFTSPSDTEWYSGLVPGADAELYYGSTTPDGEVIYYSGTSTGLEVIGVIDAGTLVMSNTKKVLVYPCMTGTSWTDTYFGSVGSYTKGGEISVAVVAQCDVITPAGTFYDVLRLNVVEGLDYTYFGKFVLHRDITIAVYRAPGFHHPVMYCITSTGTDELGNPIPGLYGEQCQWLRSDISTNTQSLAPTLSAWTLLQNPVEDLLRVSGTVRSDVATYRIRAADGNLVREGPARDLRTGVVVDDLSSGIYLLQCDGAAVRFIKE